MNAGVRTGKIARLPQTIRDQLNRRLEDGGQGKTLAAWLNSLPEVRAVLKEHFGGRNISEQNLSEWKQGGYRDWQLRQDAIEAVQRMDTDAGELESASKTPIISLLMKGLAARYAVATQTLTRSDRKGELDVPLLHQLCRDVIALRRSDSYAERVQIERSRADLECNQERRKQNDEMLKWAWKHREEVLAHLKAEFHDQVRFYRKVLGENEVSWEAAAHADEVEELASAIKQADADAAGQEIQPNKA